MKTEHMIPKAYMQSGDMRTLCRFFDLEFDLLKYQTDHILDCYSPEHCQEHLLPELAAHIGFDYQELKSVMYNRVVLKHFIKDLIRYRGSATGIANAAAIDIRYRMKYPQEKYVVRSGYFGWEEEPKAGEDLPMNYHEAIPVERTWIDVDHPNGIIYLFVIASEYFSAPETEDPNFKGDKSNFFQGTSSHDERMRRLLDLAYLQEYVRPVGMYLLPMVAEKVNAHTDLTVKAVRVSEKEYGLDNGIMGTPNASEQDPYDRIHFAQAEDGTMKAEPWVRTLYHSQQAGNLNYQYFTKPVYHIDGKFLYYDHSELMDIYSDVMRTQTGGMKVGDSLYNPNMPDEESVCFSYTADPALEPESLQEEDKVALVRDSLLYEDHVGFGKIRIYQKYLMNLDSNGKYWYGPDEELMVVYAGEPVDENGNPIQNKYPVYLFADDAQKMGPDHPYISVVPEEFLDPDFVPGHPDDGTNKHLIFNLFQIDPETGDSAITGPLDIGITGKPWEQRLPVPYSTEVVSLPLGSDVFLVIHEEVELTDENHDLFIP